MTVIVDLPDGQRITKTHSSKTWLTEWVKTIKLLVNNCKVTWNLPCTYKEK